jgi:hypothetical protein
MSGIYSRAKYDDCDYANIKAITEGAGRYRVNLDQVRNNQLCISGVNPTNARIGYVSPNEFSNASLLTDMESHMWNIDIPTSNCLSGRTLLERNARAREIAKDFMIAKVECNQELNPRNSRLDNPALLVREATTSRFDFPIVPHTAWFFDGHTGTTQVGNARAGISSRLDAKDSLGK